MRISDWSSDVCSSDLEAVDAGDAVADRQDLTDFADRCVGAEIGDLVLDDLADFSGADFHCLAFHRANWAYGLSALHRLGETVDRKSVVSGTSVSERVDLGGRRIIKKKKGKSMRLSNMI